MANFAESKGSRRNCLCFGRFLWMTKYSGTVCLWNPLEWKIAVFGQHFFLASSDVAVLNEPGTTPKLGFLPLKTSVLHYIRGKKSSCRRSFGTNCKQTKTLRKQRSSPVVSETEQVDHETNLEKLILPGNICGIPLVVRWLIWAICVSFSTKEGVSQNWWKK